MIRMSLDLETLGTSPGCALLSIGAVIFDQNGLKQEFYRAVNREDNATYGLKEDGSTEQWWLRQSEAAREAAFAGGSSIKEALAAFDKFYIDSGTTEYWANGANFDGPYLEAVYRAIGWEVPWKYNSARCARTVFQLANVSARDFAGEGVYHNALDDAKAQALAIIAGLKTMVREKENNENSD